MEDFCAAIGKTRSLIPHHTTASGRWQSVKRMVLHGSKPKELPILPVKRSMDSQKFVSWRGQVVAINESGEKYTRCHNVNFCELLKATLRHRKTLRKHRCSSCTQPTGTAVPAIMSAWRMAAWDDVVSRLKTLHIITCGNFAATPQVQPAENSASGWTKHLPGTPIFYQTNEYQ